MHIHWERSHAWTAGTLNLSIPWRSQMFSIKLLNKYYKITTFNRGITVYKIKRNHCVCFNLHLHIILMSSMGFLLTNHFCMHSLFSYHVGNARLQCIAWYGTTCRYTMSAMADASWGRHTVLPFDTHSRPFSNTVQATSRCSACEFWKHVDTNYNYTMLTPKYSISDHFINVPY